MSAKLPSVPTSSAVIWPTVVLGGLAAGCLAASGSLFLIALPIGAIGIVIGVLQRPQLVLTVGVLCTLAGRDFVAVARLGHGVLLVGGAVALLVLLTDRSPWMPRLLWLPLVTIGWLAVRLGFEGGFSVVRPFVSCIAAILLAAVCMSRERDWLTELAWGFATFVGVSSVFGALDPTGLRFEGISGNANRMVFGLLVGIPVMAALAVGRRSTAIWVVMLVSIGAAVRLVMISGSDQGTVGLAILAVAALVYAAREMDRISVGLLLALGTAVVVAYVLKSNVLQTLSPDTTTLSGRTLTYRAGLLEFRQHFWLGSGEQHVGAGIVTSRSAHNSTIGIAASAGILGLLLWISYLLRSLWFGVVRLRLGQLASAAAISVIVSQTVQTVEVAPLTWAVLTLCASPLIARDVVEEEA